MKRSIIVFTMGVGLGALAACITGSKSQNRRPIYSGVLPAALGAGAALLLGGIILSISRRNAQARRLF